MPHEAQATEAVIEFSGEMPSALEEVAAKHPREITLMRAKGLGASDYTIQALIAVVPVTVRLLAPIIRAHIEAKQHVRLKIKGRELDGELQGLSADEIIRVLDEISRSAERD